MSPVPPPAGCIPPTDDWTDDASFDLSITAQNFALPRSPTASSSSSSTSPRHHHRTSLSGPTGHVSSPLRQSHLGKLDSATTSKRNDNDDEDDDFDFDLPDKFPATPSASFPSSSHSSARPSSLSSMRNLPSTIIGKGPQGIGTVTRLGGKSGGPSVPTGSVLARARAIESKAREDAWEKDVDFDSNQDDDDFDSPPPQLTKLKLKPKRLTLSPPKRRIMPGPDALDDIDFDAEDNEATLKAGATIKAMLPPPRSKLNQATITNKPDELESDFVLPLNMKNLTLASQAHSHDTRADPFGSKNSKEKEPWDSPSTSTSGDKKSAIWGGWDDSPKRYSETSGTSITDHQSKPSKDLNDIHDNDSFNETDDMEEGLVLPSAQFFSSGRAKELNKILDKKRKPQNTPAATNHRRQGTDDSFRMGDESVEDGLVLEDPRAELSRKRLHRAVKSRTPNNLTLKKGGARGSASREARERAWEKQREQGWGRHIPSQPIMRDRNQPAIGLGSLRSHSTGATALKDMALGTPTLGQAAHSGFIPGPDMGSLGRKSDLSTGGSTLTRDSTHRTRLHSLAMQPPPIPETRVPGSMGPPTTTLGSTSRLRTQKSFYHMPPQSPSLARKQSLASLQDAIASGQAIPPVPQSLTKLPTTSPPEQSSRYHNSTSRLTMPTSSSRAKSRPTVQSVFPKTEVTASSSASSMGTTSSREVSATLPSIPRSKSSKGGSWSKETAPKTMSLPKKPRRWDGSELDGIEDMPVENKYGSGSFGRSKSRRALELTAQPMRQVYYPEHDRHRSSEKPRSKPRIGRRMPALISHKGRNDKVIVVGDMTFNPRTQRWEGNEALLRDFDPPTAPTVRPALITHYTGSSGGGLRSPAVPGTSGVGSTATVRIVGNMMFDPEKMCWVSTLPPEEDEPDPFEGMADDEDDFDFGAGGTITRSQGKKLFDPAGKMKISQSSTAISVSGTSAVSQFSGAWSSRLASESSLSTVSWEDRLRDVPGGAGAEGMGGLVSEDLLAECKSADERHKKEMRGWLVRGTGSAEADKRDRERREEKRLWEIRVLATS